MFVRVCSEYAEVISALRDRTAEMQISREAIDAITGLADGYSAKLLSLQPSKILGPLSWGPMLKTLGLRLMLIEDTAATTRTIKLREPVDQSNQRFGNKCNSKHRSNVESVVEIPRIEPPPPALESRAHLRVIQERRRGSKYA
jgi:hypothetical protein